MINNVQCLKCFKADKDLLAFIEESLGQKKVFVGFIEGSIIGIQLSEDITFTDGLVISDTVKRMTEECL